MAKVAQPGDIEAPAVGTTIAVSGDSSSSDDGWMDFFRNPENADEYAYMEQADPDKHSTELDHSRNIVVRVFQFVTRGQGIPWKAISALVIWTTFITTATYFWSRNWSGNPDGECRGWCSQIAIDSSVISYVGFALFLLLGFRVNDAYARYMEGVRIWNDDIAGVVAAFCTFTGMAFRRGLFHKNDRERIFGLAAAYAVTLKRTLRDEKDLRELKGMLSPLDLAAIQNSPDMPGHCIYVLNAYLMQAARKRHLYLPPNFLTMLMGHTQQMAAYQGQVTRIRNFKIVWGSYILPLVRALLLPWLASRYERADFSFCGAVFGSKAILDTYTSSFSFIRVSLAIWFALLPLALIETSGWYTILWVPLIGYGVIGMETMSKELVDPFGYQFNDIRLGLMTRAIQDDVRNIYRKSVSGALGTPLDTPNMLETAEGEWGVTGGDVTQDRAMAL